VIGSVEAAASGPEMARARREAAKTPAISDRVRMALGLPLR
jgi:hypothetical protein